MLITACAAIYGEHIVNYIIANAVMHHRFNIYLLWKYAVDQFPMESGGFTIVNFWLDKTNRPKYCAVFIISLRMLVVQLFFNGHSTPDSP